MRIKDYLDEALSRYFENKNVLVEDIVSPEPSIAVPAIEALRYTANNEDIRTMFVNLLGSSMNSSDNHSHPAFVEIIKQMTSDECRIIKCLLKEAKRPMIKIREKIPKECGGGERDLSNWFSDIGYEASCAHPDKFPVYLDNLVRLGLVDSVKDRYLVDDAEYTRLMESNYYPNVTTDAEIVVSKGYYNLSSMGIQFCEACVI